MNKVKPIRHFQMGKINTFWFVWKVWLPLGILSADMFCAYNSVAKDSSVDGLVLMRLVSAWQYWHLSGILTTVIGFFTGTIAAIIKRSIKKGALVGLEAFLESFGGSIIESTTASLMLVLRRMRIQSLA